jgi:hypothetical protein
MQPDAHYPIHKPGKPWEKPRSDIRSFGPFRPWQAIPASLNRDLHVFTRSDHAVEEDRRAAHREACRAPPVIAISDAYICAGISLPFRSAASPAFGVLRTIARATMDATTEHISRNILN